MKCAINHCFPVHYKHLLFQELKAGGLDFEVMFAASQSSIRHEKIDLNKELYRYRIGFEGLYDEAPRATRAIQTWRAISDINPDVAIISGYHAAECWAAWLWAHLHGRKVVMWYESNEFDYPNRPWWKETLKRIFLRGVNQAHVYGASNKAYLAKLGLPADNIAVKRAVANVEIFSVPAESKTYSAGRAKRLLYVGRLAKEKNVDLLLRAIAAATRTAGEPLWMLTIAGRGPLENDLRKLCVTLGIDDFVVFKGYCSQADLPQLYREADVLVLPSTREPWGLVALEAMLSRLPIAVSTQCGCAIDLVTPETGWAFSPWDDESLTDILLKLSEMDSTQLASMGSAGYDVAADYSAPACASRIIHFLRKLKLQSDRSPGSVECEPNAGGTR